MSKGKKFNAAEKHFQEKEIKLKRLMHEYEESAKEANDRADKIQIENDKLIEENNRLKETNQILMDLNNLKEEDINLLLERSKHLKNLDSLMNLMKF